MTTILHSNESLTSLKEINETAESLTKTLGLWGASGIPSDLEAHFDNYLDDLNADPYCYLIDHMPKGSTMTEIEFYDIFNNDDQIPSLAITPQVILASISAELHDFRNSN